MKPTPQQGKGASLQQPKVGGSWSSACCWGSLSGEGGAPWERVADEAPPFLPLPAAGAQFSNFAPRLQLAWKESSPAPS